MSKFNPVGSLGLEYAEARKGIKSRRYRLWRRTCEVLLSVEQFAGNPIRDVIDLGTADARMLDSIHQKYPNANCVGVECNQELVDFARATFPHLKIFKGDVQSLDFQTGSFDVCIAAALIEHVPDPLRMVQEVKRILKPRGIFVLTSPDPFWERLAVLVGHIKREQHQVVMNLKELQDLVEDCGFTVLKAQKFMLSPIGMPFEFIVEKGLRSFRLNSLMANQLLVARS